MGWTLFKTKSPQTEHDSSDTAIICSSAGSFNLRGCSKPPLQLTIFSTVPNDVLSVDFGEHKRKTHSDKSRLYVGWARKDTDVLLGWKLPHGKWYATWHIVMLGYPHFLALSGYICRIQTLSISDSMNHCFRCPTSSTNSLCSYLIGK